MICSFICSQTLYASASSSSSAADKDVQLKSHYDQLLLGVQKELEIQKDQVTRSQTELSAQREQVPYFCFTPLLLELHRTLAVVDIILPFYYASPDLERSGGAADSEGAGGQAPGGDVSPAEEV